MPEITKQVTIDQQQTVALDRDGTHIFIGDRVALELVVTSIDPKMDPQTGKEVSQVLTLSYAHPNGYHEHHLRDDAVKFKKIG